MEISTKPVGRYNSTAEYHLDQLYNVVLKGKMTLRAMRRHFDREAPLGQAKIVLGSGQPLSEYRMRQLKALAQHWVEWLQLEMIPLYVVELTKDAANCQYVITLRLLEDPANATNGQYKNLVYALVDTIHTMKFERHNFDWIKAMVEHAAKKKATA